KHLEIFAEILAGSRESREFTSQAQPATSTAPTHPIWSTSNQPE
ncbi:6546_t:CDS:1, partial [Racocetra fulgida]